MGIPYRARVNERWFLNLPGLRVRSSARPLLRRRPHDFEPRVILEIADCNDRINLEFDLETESERANSLHKIDTLVATLRVLRAGLEAEFVEYDRRERELA